MAGFLNRLEKRVLANTEFQKQLEGFVREQKKIMRKYQLKLDILTEEERRRGLGSAAAKGSEHGACGSAAAAEEVPKRGVFNGIYKFVTGKSYVSKSTLRKHLIEGKNLALKLLSKECKVELRDLDAFFNKLPEEVRDRALRNHGLQSLLDELPEEKGRGGLGSA